MHGFTFKFKIHETEMYHSIPNTCYVCCCCGSIDTMTPNNILWPIWFWPIWFVPPVADMVAPPQNEQYGNAILFEI